MVRQAAHPEALIIFGAAFDPELEDEMLVTVIATGYDEEAMKAAESNIFTKTAEKVEQERVKVAADVQEANEEPTTSEEDDQWQSIFNIFNRD